MTTSSPQEFLLITTFAPDGNSTFMEKKKKKKKRKKNVTAYVEVQRGSGKINYINNLNTLWLIYI